MFSPNMVTASFKYKKKVQVFWKKNGPPILLKNQLLDNKQMIQV